MAKKNQTTPAVEAPAAVTPEATTAPETVTATPAKKEVTSWTKTLSSGNDQFLVIAMAGKGGVSVYAVYQPRDEKKKPIADQRQRGVSSKHATMPEAIKAAQAIVDAAVKQGWNLPQPLALKGGFTPKPDAFTASSLPAPRKAQATVQA